MVQDNGYGIRDTGYRMRDTGYGMRDAGYGSSSYAKINAVSCTPYTLIYEYL